MSAPCAACKVHNLSGPVRVTDAEGKPAMPGDILVVEICDLGALEGDEWGFTGIFDRENGASVVRSAIHASHHRRVLHVPQRR